AELEPEDPLALLAARADDDDRHRAQRAGASANLRPVHVGQTEVEQDEVDPEHGFDGVSPGCHPSDQVPRALETLDHRLGDGVVVLDHEQSHTPSMDDYVGATTS